MLKLSSLSFIIVPTMDAKYRAYAELPENLKISEVADFARVTQQTVYRWLASGQIPATRFGTSVRIAKSDLYDFIASSGTK